jgi:hypothetical protein
MKTNTAKAAPPEMAESRFGGPLTPGLVDRLGERWTTVDAVDSSPLELLRFRPEVATAPGFEDALRERVKLLNNFKDLSFATVRDIVKEGDRLTLISTRIPGQRLSDIASKISKTKRIAFVTRLLRDVTRALSALEAVAPGVTHGALTADRIIVTSDGRACVTEYVLASALQELALWPEELWTDFGLLARPDQEGEAVFDPRTTVVQLGVVALSVLLARPITLQDFEQRRPALLDEFTALASNAPPSTTTPLRQWLEHALQLGADPYRTAAEAEAGSRKLQAKLGPASKVDVETIRPGSRTEAAVDKPEEPRAVPEIEPPFAGRESASPRERYLLWAAVVLLAIGIGEAIAIGRLVMRPPTVVLTDSSITIESAQAGDTVMVDGKPVGSTPLRVRVNPKTQAIRLVTAPPAVAAVGTTAPPVQTDTDRTATAIEAAAARQRSGGIAITSTIPLTVLQGDRVLGSTADGPIVTTAGQHQLDFVNAALGYRSRQTVTIRQGVITPLTINPPMGRLSINAQPWAQVLVDDAAVGETPLANLAVPIGEHQVTFRHPQMGERRERVTVRADAPARISTTFQR